MFPEVSHTEKASGEESRRIASRRSTATDAQAGGLWPQDDVLKLRGHSSGVLAYFLLRPKDKRSGVQCVDRTLGEAICGSGSGYTGPHQTFCDCSKEDI
jgi:hypothetical protein